MSEAATEGQQRLWTREFVLLTAIQTIDLFTYNMITPVIAKYALEQGATLVMAGFVASAFAFVALFARPLSGFLSDRLGRRRIVLVSIGVAVVSQVGYVLVGNFWGLVALRALHGFFYALFGTAISAMAIDALPEARRSEGMGWFGTSYVFANALGPALGVFLSATFGFVVMFAVGALVAALSLVLGFFVGTRKVLTAAETNASAETLASAVSPRQTKAKGEGRTQTASSTTAAEATTAAARASAASPSPHGIARFISIKSIPLAIVACCYLTIWALISTYIVLVGDVRGVVGISAFFIVNSLTLFFSRPIAGRFADKHGLSAIFYPSTLFETAGVLIIAFTSNLWLFLVAAVCKAIGCGTVTPSIQARCGELEPPERSGVAMSTYLLGTDIGNAIGPIIGGAISSAFGFSAMFLVGIPILAVGVIVYALWARHIKQETTA